MCTALYSLQTACLNSFHVNLHNREVAGINQMRKFIYSQKQSAYIIHTVGCDYIVLTA